VLPTVPVSPIRLDDYVEAAGEEAVQRLREAARPLEGARILNLNSTAFGGGVSELLLTQLGMLQDLRIDATWQLIQGPEEFFAVTKAAHNGLQGADVRWTTEMMATYMDTIEDNALQLDESYDFYFVHDPQPCGLLAVLEERGRKRGKWLWRCHIDTSAPKQHVWDFFAPLINRYDAAIFTMQDYAHAGVNGPKLAFITPTIDPVTMTLVSVPIIVLYGIGIVLARLFGRKTPRTSNTA